VNRDTTIIPSKIIEKMILRIRGVHVILDFDVASLYGVETGALNRAVKRNIARFPHDFMFQLDKAAFEDLKCQFGISNQGGGRRSSPFAFTEQGVAMLSGVLRSERAVKVNIELIRTFVQLRRMLASHDILARKLASLEQKYDGQFRVVFDAIRQLMSTPQRRSEIGFTTNREEPG